MPLPYGFWPLLGALAFFSFSPAIWRGSMQEQLTCSTDLNQQLSPSIHDGSTRLDAKFNSSLHYSPAQVFSGLQGLPFSIKLIDFSVWITLQGSWYDASGWLALQTAVVSHSSSDALCNSSTTMANPLFGILQ